MVVASSRVMVRDDVVEDFRVAFRVRPHLVNGTPCLVRTGVLRPPGQPEKVGLATRRGEEASFDAWHRSHSYSELRAGNPRGPTLVPAQQRVSCPGCIAG